MENAITADTQINTTGDGATGADILFSSTVESLLSNNLTLTAGAGDITFMGDVGSWGWLNNLTITSARDVSLPTTDLTLTELTQEAGTGTTTLNGPVKTMGPLNLTGTNLAVNAKIDAGSTVTVKESGTATFAADGDIDAEGEVSITAAGGISTAGDVMTTSDDVTFASATTLTGPVAINTGAGAGGDICFSGTVDGTAGGAAENLTLTAGTGDITFSGKVGGTAPLGSLTITSAANVNLPETCLFGDLTQTAGTGTTTLAGPTEVDGVSVNNTNITVNGALTSVGGIDFAGTLTTRALITSGGPFTQVGNATVGADITTNDTDLTIAGDLTIAEAASPTLSTGAGGNIRVTGTTNGAVLGVAQNLTLDAGTGDITFMGDVGGKQGWLNNLTITSARDVSLPAMYLSGTLTQEAGTGTTTLNGAVKATAVNLTGTNLAVEMDIFAGSTVTVNESGTATFAADGDIQADGGVSIAAAGGISTAGDVRTTNDNVTFASATTLTGPVAINTGAGAGNILFLSTVDGTAGGAAENLTLTAGTGTITFDGAVGGDVGLGTVTVTHSGGTTFGGALTATTVDLKDTTEGQTIAFNGDTTITTLTTAEKGYNVSFTGASNEIGGTTTFNNTGTVTLGDEADDTTTFAAGVTATNPSAINLAGNIITTSGSVNLGAPVTLVANSTIDTAAGNNDIRFGNTLDGNRTLTLTAGTGNITFADAVGGTTALGDIVINSANDVTANGAITAASLTQTAGTGNTTLNGAVNTAGNISLTNAGTQNINGTITTTNNGTVTFTNGGLLTLNGDIFADGAVTQNGAGLVTINTDRSITTTGDAVSFDSAVTLKKTVGTGTLTIDTTNAGGSPAGADVAFNSTLTGTTAGDEPLTLNAGSGGDILFNNTVGATRLGAITITNANDVTANGAITAETLTQTAGTGTTTLNGAVTTGPVAITTGAVNINAAVNTGSSAINLTATDGAITEGTNGLINTTGTLTTISSTGQTLNGANTVGAFNAVNSTSGSIVFTNTANPLTITGIGNSGGGAITVNNTGAIDITGAVEAGSGGAVNLASTNSSITETGNGLINTTGTLTTISSTGQTLNGANTVGTFHAVNTVSGNIVLNNTANPVTLAITNYVGGIDVTNAGAMTFDGTVTAVGSGAVNLRTTGATSDILVNNNVESGSGAVTLTAGRDIALTGTSVIGTGGDVSLTAGGNVNGGSTRGRTITFDANTIGLVDHVANGTFVSTSETAFGSILVKARSQQNGISARLYSTDSLVGRVDPDGSPGSVFLNKGPLDTATANVFEQSQTIRSATLSQSEEKTQNMVRDAGLQAFFFVAPPAFREELNATQIVVDEDGMIWIK